MAASGFTLPTNREYLDTVKYLLWNQFPVLFDTSIRYFASLPATGAYRQVRSGVKDFKKALLETSGRDLTINGIGSLIDYEKFGQSIKRPTPQLQGTGCNGNSLCLEPTCFGFSEGVIETNNMIRNICWELSMPCLKDMFYSDSQFERKMKQYFAMFMAQAPAVLESFQRTNLLKEAIKVTCLNKNIRWTGSVIGGTSGISLPFYIDPNDPYAFPDLDTLPGGAEIGGANLKAFTNFVAPRLFSGAFSGGIQSVRCYGLTIDKNTAIDQTASVSDSGVNRRDEETRFESMLGEFVHDPLFPTFFANTTTNVLELSPAEVLEAATIAGYIQTDNPQHSLNKYRGLLFVPDNWMYELVEPPKDNFAELGLPGLNFLTSSPGVFPVLSSSLFSSRTLGPDGTVIIGQGVKDGMVEPRISGLQSRTAAIREAIRTQLLLTYSRNTCNQELAGQLTNVGARLQPQGQADGFALKSTMYVGSAVKGQAKPVLLLFQTDTPRSAVPINVCSVTDVDVSASAPLAIINCSPGGQTYAVLTFNKAVGSAFAVNNLAILRTGGMGNTYLVKVTAVSGAIVTVSAVDSAGTLAPSVLLPCCTGSPDDYGSRVELIKTTGATLLTSEIKAVKYDADNDTLAIETYFPLAAATAGDDGTITLVDGTAIQVTFSADKPVGVFSTIEADSGETCDFSTLDCSCLLNAVFTMDEGT